MKFCVKFFAPPYNFESSKKKHYTLLYFFPSSFAFLLPFCAATRKNKHKPYTRVCVCVCAIFSNKYVQMVVIFNHKPLFCGVIFPLRAMSNVKTESKINRRDITQCWTGISWLAFDSFGRKITHTTTHLTLESSGWRGRRKSKKLETKWIFSNDSNETKRKSHWRNWLDFVCLDAVWAFGSLWLGWRSISFSLP